MRGGRTVGRAQPFVTLVLALSSLAAVAFAPRAHAASKDECVASYEKAQQLRRGTQLVEARAELLICAADACPGLVRDDCIRWIRELETAIPTIIVSVRTPDARDLTDVRIFSDDKLLLSHADGSAVALNAGPHVLRVEVPGELPIQESIVVNQGEQNRVVHFTAHGIRAPIAAEKPTPIESRHPAVLPFVLGGIGAASLIVGGVLDGVTWSDLSQERNSCGPSCPLSDKASFETRFAVGDSLLLGGVLLVAAGTTTFLLARSRGASSSAALSSVMAPRLRLTPGFSF
jgi:hypothetical protein